MAKKSPDDNDLKQAQGSTYKPTKGTKPFRAADSGERTTNAPSTSQQCGEHDGGASQTVFPAHGWVKLHSQPAPRLAASWKLLSWRARGLYRLLLTECNSDGVIPLGKAELRGIAGFVSGSWDEIEPVAQELIDSGWLVWDDSGQLLAVAYFRESQAKQQSDGARRTAEWRARTGQRR